MYVVHQATLNVGNPTWFCSFSAAETRWNHLLKILGRLVDHREYSDCEINEMTWQKHRHAKHAGVIFSIDWVAWGRTGC